MISIWFSICFLIDIVNKFSMHLSKFQEIKLIIKIELNDYLWAFWHIFLHCFFSLTLPIPLLSFIDQYTKEWVRVNWPLSVWWHRRASKAYLNIEKIVGASNEKVKTCKIVSASKLLIACLEERRFLFFFQIRLFSGKHWKKVEKILEQ